MAKANNGIYTYVGKLNKHQQFNDENAHLTHPSGAVFEGQFARLC